MLLTLALLLAASPGLLNPSFDEGEIGQLPPGWKSGSAEIARDGLVKCAMLRHKPPFGNLMQVLDATPYRGKNVRFRAAVRTDGTTRAQLWLRVDRPGGMGFFDNMGDRPIVSDQWSPYTIEGEVAADARSVNIGLMVVQPGHAWIDDVVFEITGEAAPLPAEPPRPLSDRGRANLTAFARLLGYVRYFYPGNESAAADWNTFAIESVRKVEDASDLAATLKQLFAPLAPAVQLFPTGQKPLPVETKGWLIHWRHHGLGSGQPGIYQSQLLQDYDPQPPYQADLGGGVSCLVPLALPAPEQVGALKQQRPGRATGNDRATRLADVILAWNVFQHFYPYFDVVKADWPRELQTALAAAATDADEKAFLFTLQRMVAGLHDGHGRVFLGNATATTVPPVLWDWIEGKLVVTFAPGGELAPGDVVLAIDGRPVADLLSEQEQLISGATPQWIRANALRRLGARAEGGPVVLRVDPWKDPGKLREVTLQRVSTPPAAPRPQQISEPEPGIFYVDLRRITDEDWEQALPRLEHAKGIVFDMRGYPGNLKNPARFFGTLSGDVLTSAQWHVPVVTMPDRRNLTFDRSRSWQIPPRLPYLRARRAFLTSAAAISYAESCMGIVEHYKLGEIVGGPTAGTNGNVNPFTLPGGYSMAWTGMKVLKHDGSRHHGVGILPTIPVEPTRAGVAAGRDEVLERALQAVRDK